MTALLQPPASDELEVSLFGPGYGECVLVHLGAGEWLIVDSCFDQRSREQPALAYLQQLGLDPASCVKLVVASHWHDDHVRGLATVVETCSSAGFACAVALSTQETQTLIQLIGPVQYAVRGGVSEFYDTLEVLKQRATGRPRIPVVQWAAQDKRLFQRAANLTTPACEVMSLAPSDTAFTLAVASFRQLLADTAQRTARLPAMTPNHNAVVLWVTVGNVSVLLGADLEETAHPHTGWSAIVASTTKPFGRAEVFKVPHHGSVNGHHAPVWQNMLISAPHALPAPFMRGGVSLPSESDLARLQTLTTNGFITVPPAPRATIRDKMREGAARSIYEAHGGMGHICVRRSIAPGESWEELLSGKAMRIVPSIQAEAETTKRRTKKGARSPRARQRQRHRDSSE